MRQLVAVDLFCGAGGLTEGFKQAGIDIKACLDIWSPAVETHRKNHPKTDVFQADILDFEESRLPDCDVLVGSPPCTEFSYANRGGHGDLGVGMKFVLRFLRIVHEKRPKYWIMENVPRLFQTLPPRVSLRRLGIQEDGFFEVPVRRILNAADYGVPQKRLRLISGKYPVPEPTHSWAEGLGSFENLRPWLSVKHVVGLLPDPLGKADPVNSATDPCYDLELPESKLTDHFMDTRLNQEEIDINRKSKTDHSWYGRMAFPDPLDRPARTVMATQTGISRETLVIEWKYQGRSCFRRPTIRECASFQSFPISYQFWGNTAQTRYKLVGNAVPPLLASALARGILLKEGQALQPTPIVSGTVSDLPPPVSLEHIFGGRRKHLYPETRKFRDHIAGSKAHGIRVDFANSISVSSEDDESYEVRWEARLVAGSGKTVFVVTPGLAVALKRLAIWSIDNGETSRVEHFLSILESDVRQTLPDAETLQDAWTERAPKSTVSPPGLLRTVAGVVDASFPPGSFGDGLVNVRSVFPHVGRDSIPIRALAQLTALSFVADTVNTGGRRESLLSIFKSILSSSLGSQTRRKIVFAGATN